MPKVLKKATKKTFYKRRKRFDTSIVRTKVEVEYMVNFPVNQSGDVQFTSAGGNAFTAITLNTLLNQSPSFPTFKSLFSYYKVSGISYLWSPSGITASASTIGFPIYLSAKVGNQVPATLQEAMSTPSSMILTPAAPARKYYSFGTGDWYQQTDVTMGVVTLNSSQQSTAAQSQFMGSIKFVVYLHFKNQIY